MVKAKAPVLSTVQGKSQAKAKAKRKTNAKASVEAKESLSKGQQGLLSAWTRAQASKGSALSC
eukprot:8774589-Lingulodinium_polyedra.AAC.1